MAKELTTLLIVAVVMIVLLTGVLYFLPCGTTIEKFAAPMPVPASANEIKIANAVAAYFNTVGIKGIGTPAKTAALLQDLKAKKVVLASTTAAQLTQQLNKPVVLNAVLSKLNPTQLAAYKAQVAANLKKKVVAKKPLAKSVTLVHAPVHIAALNVANAKNSTPAAIAKVKAEAAKIVANPKATPAAKTAAQALISAKTPVQIQAAAANLAAATISKNAQPAVKAAAGNLAAATTPAQRLAAAKKLKAAKANAAVKPAVKVAAKKVAKANTPVKAATAAAKAAKVIKTTPKTKAAVTAAAKKLATASSHIEAKVAASHLVAASAAVAADTPAIKAATAALAAATTPAQAKAAITKLVAATSPAVASKPAVKAAIAKLAAAKTPAQVKVAATQLAAATTGAKAKAAANPSSVYGMNGVLTAEQCSTLCPVDFTENSLTGIPVGAIQRTVATIHSASKNSPLANAGTLEKAYVTAGFQDYIAHDIEEDFEDEDFENEEGFSDMSDIDEDFEDMEGFANMSDDDDDDDENFEDYDKEDFENENEGFTNEGVLEEEEEVNAGPILQM